MHSEQCPLPYVFCSFYSLDFLRACVVLAVSGIAYGLCRPSPSPVYHRQNDLPFEWSGQLPYFFICMALNATSIRICAYINFWIEHRRRRIRTVEANVFPRRANFNATRRKRPKSPWSWFTFRGSAKVTSS